MSTWTLPVRDGGLGRERPRPRPARWRAAREQPAEVRAAGPARRSQILDAACEAFAEHGYQGASVRAIAARAGISHAGLLHHFTSKELLLGAVIDRLEARAQAALDETPQALADRDEIIEGIVAFYDPTADLVQLLATLDHEGASTLYPERMRGARLRRANEFILERRFAQLAEQGCLRPHVSPAFASRMFLSLVMGYATREKTVRALQRADHGDDPRIELRGALRLVLAETGSPARRHRVI